MRQPLSLKGRALALLGQREQSRLELRRKLLRHLGRGRVRGEGAERDPEADAAAIEALLAELESAGLLSAERFVESRVHARAGRFGSRRIEAELAQHGLALPEEARTALRESELARAADVRGRRFADPPADADERARQSRFLLARGFAPETIRRLMKGLSARA